MKFKEFIKEKILLILLVLFIITSSEILLLPYPQIEIFVRLYIAICPIIIISIDIIIEYRKKNNFYKELKNNFLHKYNPIPVDFLLIILPFSPVNPFSKTLVIN